MVRVSSTSVRDELVSSLRETLRAHGRPLLQHEASTKLMLDRAVTKKKRQEKLAMFFRSVFAEVLLRGVATVVYIGIYTPPQKKKLDGHGRARREAARRRKSEWKVNLDIRNFSRGSASKRLQKLYLRTTWRMDLRQLTVYEHFGCVNICAHTFFVCGPKFTTSPRKLW